VADVPSGPRLDSTPHYANYKKNPNICMCFVVVVVVVVVGGGGGGDRRFFWGGGYETVPPKRSQYSDWLRAGRPRGRSSSPGGVKNFHSYMSCRPALGPTKPPIQWVPGALSPGVKQPGCEADHSLPTTAEVKKTLIYTSTSLYAFMALCLIS
jgi:hypothetical protein